MSCCQLTPSTVWVLEDVRQMLRNLGCVRVFFILPCVSLTACQSVWQGPPRRIDFTLLKQADHIRVCGRSCDQTAQTTIDDPEKIRAATTFIEAYADGWRDSWNGPPGGIPNLFFYQGKRVLGGYGMTPIDVSDVLVSVGTGSRRVSASEIAVLMKRLDLQWPLR